jgi:hypothetical protein
MLSFPAAIKFYLCTVPCDMRRSFDGLSMMAEHVIRCNPFSVAPRARPLSVAGITGASPGGV